MFVLYYDIDTTSMRTVYNPLYCQLHGMPVSSTAETCWKDQLSHPMTLSRLHQIHTHYLDMPSTMGQGAMKVRGGGEGDQWIFSLKPNNPLFTVMSFPSFTTGCLPAAAIYNLSLYLCNSPIKHFPCCFINHTAFSAALKSCKTQLTTKHALNTKANLKTSMQQPYTGLS